MLQKRMCLALLIFGIVLAIQCFQTEADPVLARQTDIIPSDPADYRQLIPGQFSLAATRFIVMLPFLPLLMAIPSATAIGLPLVMAVQDRLKTIFPRMPTLFPRLANLNSTAQGQLVSDSVEATQTGRYRRSFLPPKGLTDRFRDVLDLFSKSDDLFNQLTSEEPDCKRQAVCRLHYAFNPTVGSFLGNMLQVLKVESQIEKLDVSSNTRSVIKDAIKAAKSGLYRQDCAAIYSRCGIAIPGKIT